MSEVKPTKGMGRKPVNIGAYGTQDAIWRGVRELREFTAADLICHINREIRVNDDTVRSYVRRLVRGGYLEMATAPKHRGNCREATYNLMRDTGVETPRLTKEGKPSKQGKGREQLWRTIKILGQFDWFELAMAASTEDCPIKESTAKHYCETLARAGYLATIRPGKAPRIKARYRLMPSKYTGPRPPQIQRVKQLYDPNLDQVVWQSGGDQ